jgi:hypothetical protein
MLRIFEKFYRVPKDYLVSAAKSEWKIPDGAISIYSKRPELTMSLLRASSLFSNNELKRIIEEFNAKPKRRG